LYYLNLKDLLSNGGYYSPNAGAIPLNGLSAFTFEAFINWRPTASDNTNFIISSAGAAMDAAFIPAGALYMSVSGSSSGPGTINVGVKLSNTEYTLTVPNAINPNTTYHTALTYNGSTIRLFVGGKLVAAQNATGQLVENPDEDLFLGGQTEGWPDLGSALSHWLGQIDSVRLSYVARYTANFLPPTNKLSLDASTLLLLNFTTQNDAFIKADYVRGSSNAWSAVRSYAFSLGPGQTVRDMTLLGGSMGLMAVHSPGSEFKNLNISISEFVGMKLFSNDFLSRIVDVNILTQRWSEAAFEAERAAGDLKISGLQINGPGYFGAVLNEGSAVFDLPYITPSDVTTAAIVLKQDTSTADIALIEPLIDAENGGSCIPLILSGNGAYVVIGGDLEVPGDSPGVRIEPRGMESVIFYGTHVELPQTAPDVLDFVADPAPVLVTPVLWFSPVVNGINYNTSTLPPFTNFPNDLTVINGAPPLPLGTPTPTATPPSPTPTPLPPSPTPTPPPFPLDPDPLCTLRAGTLEAN